MRNFLPLAALGLATACTEPTDSPQIEISPVVQSVEPTADDPEAPAHISISQNQYAQAISVASSLFDGKKLERLNNYPDIPPMWMLANTTNDHQLFATLTGGELRTMDIDLDSSFGRLLFTTQMDETGCSSRTYFYPPNDAEVIAKNHFEYQDDLERPLHVTVCKEMIQRILIDVKNPDQTF